MKILRTLMIVSALIISAATMATSQEEEYSNIYIFGYLQGAYVDIPKSFLGPSSSSFFLQQANVMAAKDFDGHFSSFLNLQFTNGYNSALKWGTMNLEEGWVKYSYSTLFNVKAGLILPTFNSLLQVRNRTPLLPYVLRPLVYEPLVTDRINVESFLPVRANVEIYGTVPVSDVNLEYAFYTGNSEANFSMSGPGAGTQVSSMDTTGFKLWGGRLGLSTHWMRAGLSMTTDKENQSAYGLGAVQRYRFGADLSLHISHVTFDGEMILVRCMMNDRQKATLAVVRDFTPLIGENFDRYFFYGTLLYDFTEAFYGYGTYSAMRMNDFIAYSDGAVAWGFGAGWRPIETVVVKAQYIKITSPSPIYPVDVGLSLFAVSVMF